MTKKSNTHPIVGLTSTAVSSNEQGKKLCSSNDYKEFLKQYQSESLAYIKQFDTLLFIVETKSPDELFELYLSKIPASMRQSHNCNCCRSFFKRYANLVGITSHGVTIPVMLGIIQKKPYMTEEERIARNAMAHVAETVIKRKIITRFYTSETTWGNPVTGEFVHLSFKLPSRNNPFKSPLKTKTEYEMMADFRENIKTLTSFLSEYKPGQFKTAIDILPTLESHGKFKAHFEWLSKVCKYNRNELILSMSKVPEEWHKPKSGMVGFLMECIKDGKTGGALTRMWNEKVDPHHYQRAQAPPKQGNLAAADKIAEQLGITPEVLQRQHALVSEVQAIYKPKLVQPRSGTGTFTSTVPHKSQQRSASVSNLSPKNISFQNFMREHMKTENKIEIMITTKLTIGGITTKANDHDVKLFKWDNDFAWYVHGKQEVGVYRHTSSPWDHIGIHQKTNDYAPVSFMSYIPPMWENNGATTNWGRMCLIGVEGANDTTVKGSALFSECLIKELHPVRSSVEAFSQNNKLKTRRGEKTVGFMFSDNGHDSITLKVTTVTGVAQVFNISLWD